MRSIHPNIVLACTLLALTSPLAAAADVAVNWLDQTAPAVSSGVSWGVPWPKGAVPKG